MQALIVVIIIVIGLVPGSAHGQSNRNTNSLELLPQQRVIVDVKQEEAAQETSIDKVSEQLLYGLGAIVLVGIGLAAIANLRASNKKPNT